MDTTQSDELRSLITVLELMAETELAIAELYNTCAHVCQEDAEFWSSIAQEEKKHADNIHRIKELILQKPECFQKGRAFNPVAIKTTISYIKNNIQRIKEGAIDKNKALFIARDIEQSLMEQKYGEIVKADDLEYRKLIEEILSQTSSHKNHFDKKIAEKK